MTKDEEVAAIEKLPFKERVITSVQDYEWLLSSETQTFWEIVQ